MTRSVVTFELKNKSDVLAVKILSDITGSGKKTSKTAKTRSWINLYA